MDWSYSRVNLYRSCPYSWFLQYILDKDKTSNFYSEYGTFIHDLLARFYKNEATRDSILTEYMWKFNSNVISKVNAKTFETMRVKYFEAGANYLETFEPFKFKKLIGVEKKISFKIGDYSFVGYIDLAGFLEDDEIEIIDHKSKDLKPRSKRKTQTLTDEELDTYLIQLYLYSIAIFEEFGKYPKYLTFNCFKNGEIIRELFDIKKLEEAKDWCLRTIHRIEKDTNWLATGDWYFCNNLCNNRNICEYLETT